MTDWRVNLAPGSWRGVPFFCRDVENPAGQRTAEFEFPDSDQVYVQGLGRGIKQYRLQLYVAGDDYFAWRNQMEAALDADGAGTLVHPYRGPVQVFAKYPCPIREDAGRGRAAFFDAVFVEAGGAEPPVPSADTAGQSQQAGAAMNAPLASTFETGSYQNTGGTVI